MKRARPDAEEKSGDDSSAGDDSEPELWLEEHAPHVEEPDSDEDAEDEEKKGGEAGGDGDAASGAADEDAPEIVDVSFVFQDPEEADALDMRKLLRHLLPRWDFNSIASAVASQVVCGTMVKVEGDNSVYGAITALPLAHHSDVAGIKQLGELLVAAAGRRAVAGRVAALFEADGEASRTALCISERMINMPHRLAPEMWKALLSDLEWAESNGTTEEKAAMAFDQLLFVLPCAIEGGSPPAGSSGDGEPPRKKKKKQKKKAEKSSAAEQTLYFSRIEEELLLAESSWHFTWKVERTDLMPKSVPLGRCALLLQRKKLPLVVQQLCMMLGLVDDE